MTYKQVADMVESIGLPCAYYQFSNETAKPCPFICWFFETSDDFAADNQNWQRIRPLSVELYTDAKDFELEERVEDVLNAAGLVYFREETWLDSQRMNMVTFIADIIISKEN